VDVVETDEYPLIDDYLGSGVEFVEGSSGVKGRLKQCFSYWESTICFPKSVLGLISEGYRLPFVRFPDKCYLDIPRGFLGLLLVYCIRWI